MTTTQGIKPGQHFVTTTHGMRGWFACEFWLNNEDAELGDFYEPWQSDPLSFATEEEAAVWAIALAKELDLPFIP